MLTVLWVNSTYQTFQTNKTNKDIQGKLDIMDNYITETSKYFNKNLDVTIESMGRITVKLESIQEQLNDTDLASALARLEEDINTLDAKVKIENQALEFLQKSTERNFNKTFNDIQSCRTALNHLAQDPNLMSRY
jgi:ABC-type phosphate transport system auxiliary subunit